MRRTHTAKGETGLSGLAGVSAHAFVSLVGGIVEDMTTTETRQRRLPECPRCGADLIVVEQRVTVAEPGVKVPWVATSRTCARGCLLTVDDFPRP